jgi:hypothetical protein
MGQELEKFGKGVKGGFRLSLALSQVDPAIQYSKPEKPLLITHVPRTGGTTLDAIIRGVGGARSVRCGRALGTVYDQYLGSEKDDAAEFVIAQKRDAQKLKYLIGHIPFGIHERLGFEDVTYGIVLREPTIRVFSQIKMSFPEVSVIGPEEISAIIQGNKLIDNIQVRMTAGCFDAEDKCDEAMLRRALHNLENYYTYVGIQENFEQFLHQIIEGENWPSVLYVSKHASKFTEINLPKSSADTLEPYIHLDKVLNAEVRKRFKLQDKLSREPVLADPETIQGLSRADIVFHVHPHRLMGIEAGSIPHRLIGGAMARLKKNGLPVDLV